MAMKSPPLEILQARVYALGQESRQDVGILQGRVVSQEEIRTRTDRIPIDFDGRVLLPGLLNGHDHLDFSTFPPLGHPPYPNVQAWARDVDAGAGNPAVTAALSVPLADRLFLGGLRNLLAGVTAVAHHNPFHRSMARPDFPVRVLEKYEYAHSAGLSAELRKTYRTTDRRIPWMVHAGEGIDDISRQDIDKLTEHNVLRQNTVIIHGIAFGVEEARRMAAARAALVWCPDSNRRQYGATADVAAFLAEGVKVGLGSDSAASGVRDPLSNLAAARLLGVLPDDELLRLATEGTAEAARLPLGGVGFGGVADLLAVTSREALLSGDRGAVALVLIGGRPLYGEAGFMTQLLPRAVPIRVDGAKRSLEPGIGHRAARILKRYPGLRRIPWLAGVRFSEGTSETQGAGH